MKTLHEHTKAIVVSTTTKSETKTVTVSTLNRARVQWFHIDIIRILLEGARLSNFAPSISDFNTLASLYDLGLTLTKGVTATKDQLEGTAEKCEVELSESEMKSVRKMLESYLVAKEQLRAAINKGEPTEQPFNVDDYITAKLFYIEVREALLCDFIEHS